MAGLPPPANPDGDPENGGYNSDAKRTRETQLLDILVRRVDGKHDAARKPGLEYPNPLCDWTQEQGADSRQNRDQDTPQRGNCDQRLPLRSCEGLPIGSLRFSRSRAYTFTRHVLGCAFADCGWASSLYHRA